MTDVLSWGRTGVDGCGYSRPVNLGAIKQVLANRSVLFALVGFVAFTLVLNGAWLVTVVYAFEQGGPAEAGAVAVGVLVPAAVLSPFVAVWFDRFAPNIALAAGYALQAIPLLLVAAVVAVGVNKFVVYTLLCFFSIAQMASRPTVSAVLPRIVRDPVQLAAANSATGLAETSGLVLGPALAGVVLYASSGVTVAFLASGIAMAVASVSALAVTVVTDEGARFDDADLTTVRSKVVEGVHLLRDQAAPRHLVIVMAAMRLVVGVLEVGVVVVAIDHLGRTEASAGLLGTAIGVGALIGSALTFFLVGRRRLSLPIALGVICASLPVALIALSKAPWLVLLLLALGGLGRPIVEVSGRTLLQGLSTDDMLARIFGLLEGLSLLVLAIGSALFSALTVALSLEAALVIAGLLPCTIVAVLFLRLRRIDESRPEVDPELLALVRTTPIFSPLPAFRIEQMMINMHRQDVAPGVVVFEQGDIGNDLHIVADGSVEIGLDGGDVTTGRGGFFGEIALLRDQPRMATVRAGSNGATTYRLNRDVFLSAIATAPLSQSRSERIVEVRLENRGD